MLKELAIWRPADRCEMCFRTFKSASGNGLYWAAAKRLVTDVIRVGDAWDIIRAPGFTKVCKGCCDLERTKLVRALEALGFKLPKDIRKYIA